MKMLKSTLNDLKTKGAASFMDAKEKKAAPAVREENAASKNAAIAAAASMEASEQISRIAQSIINHINTRSGSKPTSYKFTIKRDERTNLISSIIVDPVKKGE